jgi:C-terminal processing protease CtpA/Prc
MLAATQDAHIWLTEAGQIIPAYQRKVAPNASIKILPTLISGWSQRHPMVASGSAANGIGYIAIHSWDRKHGAALVTAALASLSDLEDKPALIIDVRFNSGGDESLARYFAGHFIRERKLYARHVTLGNTEPTDRWLEPAANSKPFAGKVAVLTGPVNMSSAEAFLLMMRQVPGCQLVGQTSFGASGNPQPHNLANGVTVYLPSWKALLPDGTLFETKGITPDVEVKAADFSVSDPVLTKAIELLGK